MASVIDTLKNIIQKLMLKLHYYPEREKPARSAARYFGNYRINPGVNENLEEGLVDFLKNTEDTELKIWFEEGVLRFEEIKEPDIENVFNNTVAEEIDNDSDVDGDGDGDGDGDEPKKVTRKPKVKM